MEIRPYRPGDEILQVEIYNQAASEYPGFKEARVEELIRRWGSMEAGATMRLYAVEGQRIVGYATLNGNGRISYPWCLPGAEQAREPLFQGLLEAATRRGLDALWATYRADWKPVLDFFHERGFQLKREYINYLARIHDLPQTPRPAAAVFSPMSRDEFRQLAAIDRGLLAGTDLFLAARYYADNAFFSPSALFALNDTTDGHLRGVGLAIADPRYADPTMVDPLMPCFRLGAFGTEHQRHKRLNGMVSFVFRELSDGEALLAEAARRLSAAGLIHAAAQAPSDVAEIVQLYDKYFQRQGTFPILSRDLSRLTPDDLEPTQVDLPDADTHRA